MPVQLSSVRVEAELDASRYISGAQAKVDADNRMVASDNKVATSGEQTDRRLGTSSTAFEKLARSIDPAYQAQQKLAAGEATLQRALDAGAISKERQAELLARLQERYKNVADQTAMADRANSQSADSFKKHADQLQANSNNAGGLGNSLRGLVTSINLNRQGLQELQAAGVNAFQALASGMSVFRVGISEGSQVLGAFVQGGAIGFSTIAGWGGILAAVGVGVAVLGTRYASTQANLREFQLALDTSARGSGATAQGLQKTSESLRDVGLSAADAAKIFQTGLANAGPAYAKQFTDNFAAIARAGANTAAVLHTTTDEGVNRYVAALRGGVPTLTEFATQIGAMTAQEASAADQAAKLGNAQTVFGEVLGRVSATLDGRYNQSLSAWGKLTQAIGIAWNDLLNHLSDTDAFKFIGDKIEQLATDGIPAIQRGFKSIVTTLTPVWQSFMEGNQQFSEFNARVVQFVGLGANENAKSTHDFLANTISEFQHLGSLADQVRQQTTEWLDSAASGLRGLKDTLQPVADFFQSLIDKITAATTALRGYFSAQQQGSTSLPEGGAYAPLPPAQLSAQPLPQTSATSQSAAAVSASDVRLAVGIALPLIAQYESGNQNVQNYRFDPTHTASGYYQITDTTWQRYAPRAGVNTSQYPTAMSSGFAVQSAVAGQIYSNEGFSPWTNYNQRLATAVTSAGAGAGLYPAPTKPQLDAMEEYLKRLRDVTEASGQTAAASEILRAKQEAERVADEKNLQGLDRQSFLEKADAEAKKAQAAAAGVVIGITDREAAGAAAVATAYQSSLAAGIRQTEVERARIQVLQQGGDVERTAAANLALHANQAVQAAQQQSQALNMTIAANENLARQSAFGTVALKNAEIENTAVSQTYAALAAAQAAYAQALQTGDQQQIASTKSTLERAQALTTEKEAQLARNQAAQETTQVNLLSERTKQQTELVEAQATAQGKTSEEIQNQVLLLRTKQQLETQYSNAAGTAAQYLVAQTEALAAANIKLGEARAAEGRLNEEIRSIADTVVNALGGALDQVLSGKKITDWGQIFRDTLRSIASTIVQSEFIKPLIGSALQGLGFNSSAQQYGTLGGAGTLLLGGGLLAGAAGGSSTVSAGAANSAATNFAGTGLSAADVAAVAADPKVAAAAYQAASAGGTQAVATGTNQSPFSLSNVGAVASLGSSLGGGGGLFGGGGFLGGIGSAINNFGGSLGFAVPGAPFSATIAGPSVPGALTSAQGAASGSLFGTTSLTGALGGIGLGATAGGLLASVTGGNSLLGSIGGGAGGLAGTILGPALFGIGGPIGGIIGGLVGGLAGLFGNNKPSNNASGAFVNTATGGISGAVSGGVAANDQAVQQISSAIGDFSKSVQSLTGGTSGFGVVNVQAGTRDGIKVGFQGITQAYGDAQSAINDVEKKIIGSLSNLTDTVKTVLAHVSDPSQLQEAVAAAAAYDKVATAFDGLFASIEKSKTTIGPYETILNQLNTQYDTLKASAEKYGLALGPVNDSYNTARQRLVDDFNKNINDALGALSNTFQQTLQNEITQAQQRVTDAKAIGADLTQVEKLNQATLERTALQAASQLGGIVAKVGDFIGTLGQSFESLFTTVESQIARLATNANGIAQLSGTDPYSTAYNALQTQQAAAIQAAQASYSNPELQNTVINAIRGVTLAGLARLATDFQANITELTLAAQNPVQEAVNKEVAAGQQRVAVAQAVGADLAQVEQFNADNLKRVATAANQSVAGIVTAQDAIKTAGTVLSASISSVVQSTKGPFAQALDSLNIAFGKLIGQIDSLGNASADVTPVLQAYAAQIDALRGTFNKQVADLTLAITDPVQAALNAELEAGQRRVADAQAIGADIAAVDEFNRLSLLKVFQSTQSAVQGASDSLNDFTNSLDSLQSALSQLTGGTLSGLTPAQAVTAAVQNFQSELALVKAGNTSEIPNLAAAGTNAVQTAQQVYGNAPQTAKIRDQITKSLQDVAISTATQASQEAAAVTTTAQNEAGNKAIVQSEATQAHKIADALQAQADLEQKRTGMVNADLQAKAETARKIANELDRQATSNADIADTTEAFSATLSTQYSQQAAKLRTIANELQGQADLERARTGLQNNVYQREADGARLVATLLDQQAVAQQATTAQLVVQANAAFAIADQLQQQANEEATRTGVKNNLLQQEATLAFQIATQLTAQANHQGESTQADADKAKLAVAQVQQQADIGQRTVDAQSQGANAATGTAATMASGLDLAIQQLQIQRQIAADTNNVAQQSISAQVNIANQVLAAQKSAADAFTAAVNAYSAAVARASAAAAVPPPPPAQPAPPAVVAPAPTQAVEDNSGNNALLSFLVGAGHAGFHARGTGSTLPGLIRVGEEGPEWLYQNGGNTILPNGIQPPSNDDDVVAELRRVREELAAMRKQIQGGQGVASRDAKQIASETASVGRKITLGQPMRRNVA